MEGTEIAVKGDTMSTIFEPSTADRLAQAGVEDAPYGLHFPKQLDRDLWEEGCRDTRGVEGRLLAIARFKLGDHANFGMKAYGLSFAQVGEMMDLAANTVKQICHTSKHLLDENRPIYAYNFSAARKAETLLPRFQRKAIERAKEETGRENPSVSAVESAVKDIIAENPKARRRVKEEKETKPVHASTIRVSVSIITDGYRKGKGHEKESWAQFEARVSKVFFAKAKTEVPIEVAMYRNPDLKAQREEDAREEKKARAQRKKDREAQIVAGARKKLHDVIAKIHAADGWELVSSNEGLETHIQAIGMPLTFPLKESAIEDVNVLPLYRILKGTKLPKPAKPPKAAKKASSKKAAPKTRKPARRAAAKKSSPKAERAAKSGRVSTKGLPFARPSDK